MIPLGDPPRRILIIKPSAIGDVVHALPVLNLVRRRWPEAQVSWVITPACAGLVENHPQVDEVIRFERELWSRTWRSPRALANLIRFAREIRARKFELVIDLQGLLRSGWIAAQSKAPVRVGFANAREFGWMFYTHRVPMRWEDHAIDRNLCMSEALGLGRGPVEFVFAVDDSDRDSVGRLLPPGRRFAVLLPGTNWQTKKWPVEKFAALVRPLQKCFDLASVVAGSADERELAAAIPGAIDLCGRTSLRQLVALLERATLVIANDSGPMHIAAALGRPMIVLHGPTSPLRTGPYGHLDSVVRLDLPCSPCFSRRCSHQSCLRWLGIEPVLELAERQLRTCVDNPSGGNYAQ